MISTKDGSSTMMRLLAHNAHDGRAKHGQPELEMPRQRVRREPMAVGWMINETVGTVCPRPARRLPRQHKTPLSKWNIAARRPVPHATSTILRIPARSNRLR
jgi:hypothetical protein